MAHQQRVEINRRPAINPFGMLLERGRAASRVRLAVLLGGLGLYWFVVTLVADFPPLIPVSTLESLPLMVGIVLDVATSFLNPQVLVYLLPVLLGVLVAFRLAALYLADLFELESTGIASRYLLGSVLGFRYPILKIDTGQVDDLDQTSPLLRIGGPGFLNLHLGFAAVFETISGEPHIYGPSPARSRFFMRGFERLRNVIDLRDQLRQLDEVRTVTKDGIAVHARDVQIVFRAFGGKNRKPGTRYSVDPQSILSLAYGGIADESGLTHWTETLPALATRELQSFVANRTLEEFLTLPEQPQADPAAEGRRMTIHIPRRALTSSFHTPERQQRLKDLGLELMWVGVGTWEVLDDQIETSAVELAAGQTLTGTARDEARAQRLRSPEHLAREREISEFALTQEVIEELVTVWSEGQLPDRYRCFELLERFKRRLLNLQERIGEAQRRDPTIAIELELPERFQDALLHLETLTDHSPTL